MLDSGGMAIGQEACYYKKYNVVHNFQCGVLLDLLQVILTTNCCSNNSGYPLLQTTEETVV